MSRLTRLFWMAAGGLLLLGVAGGCIVRKEAPELGIAGEYFGQTPPGAIPELFGPNIVSTGLNERDAAYSPDGTEFYYTIWLPMRSGVIMVMERHENRWSQPEVASFSGFYSDLEPFVSNDGRRLFFVSNRPVEAGGAPKDYDIWYVDRTDSGWTAPLNLGAPINTEANEFYPTLTAGGTVYYTGAYGESEDIYRSQLVEGRYAEPEKLSDAVNTTAHEFNSLIAPDESYLIFSSMPRADGYGGGDMYVSFRSADDVWSPAVNLGEDINSRYLDYCPSLSPDGKYLFFTANRVAADIDSTGLMTLDDVRRLYDRFQNGNGDIYWVERGVIDLLRPGH